MSYLGPDSDRAVRDAVAAFMEESERPSVDGEAVFETHSGVYRLIDGVLFSAKDSDLLGAELVGWLCDELSPAVVSATWRRGARAVLVDRRKNRHIIVTSATRSLAIDGEPVEAGSTVSRDGSTEIQVGRPSAPPPRMTPSGRPPPLPARARAAQAAKIESTRSFAAPTDLADALEPLAELPIRPSTSPSANSAYPRRPAPHPMPVVQSTPRPAIAGPLPFPSPPPPRPAAPLPRFPSTSTPLPGVAAHASFSAPSSSLPPMGRLESMLSPRRGMRPLTIPALPPLPSFPIPPDVAASQRPGAFRVLPPPVAPPFAPFAAPVDLRASPSRLTSSSVQRGVVLR